MEIKTFLTKHIFLFGLILSIGFLFVAGFKYPGESSKDINSVGYNWTDNYISNLLEYKAVNGMENKARPFGVMGVDLLGLCSGLALVRLSKKVDSKKFSIVIKYLGIILVILSSLITIPSLYDTLVTLSSAATLLLFFYVTILLIKSKLLLLKCVSIFLLLVSYGAAYMYFFRAGLDYLPIFQKTIHILQIILILGLEYFTTKKDFDQIKN